MANRFERYGKKTRRKLFLEEIEQVVPWSEVCTLMEAVYAKAGKGRPTVGAERMLSIYFFAAMIQAVRPWGGRSAVRCGGHAASCGYRSGAGTGAGRNPSVQVPSSAGAARFERAAVRAGRRAFAAEGTTPEPWNDGRATTIKAPSSTQNARQAWDPEMPRRAKASRGISG
jgi:transposase, IS5 family